MKHNINILLLLAMIMLAGCAGLAPVDKSQLTFDRIVEAPGMTKDQIYDGTRMWIAENFRSAKAVLEYENKEAGTLIGNGSMQYPCAGLDCLAKNDWVTHFTMRVDIKDGKFKVSFSNLRITWPAKYVYGSAQQAGDIQVNTQGDLGAIKPKLLAFGDEIANAISSNKAKADF